MPSSLSHKDWTTYGSSTGWRAIALPITPSWGNVVSSATLFLVSSSRQFSKFLISMRKVAAITKTTMSTSPPEAGINCWLSRALINDQPGQATATQRSTSCRFWSWHSRWFLENLAGHLSHTPLQPLDFLHGSLRPSNRAGSKKSVIAAQHGTKLQAAMGLATRQEVYCALRPKALSKPPCTALTKGLSSGLLRGSKISK